ncbi:hypothetical protein K493DRAFT_269438 [Basidiobolus meristosporus CBS 931.73]|uniref:Velvet domain-containing protein n=1 Tax=Basidiobolus meristosporus CBS 931.73 TaxID=1314790 RepID=A0A1Y1XGI2_9FUNG|nr:hypothetical protein K493DRAFT_269438 [Basidiobolus meristosporus CBS 931.73]|eukprot:ORX84861.1 hypothetical protein K493DRAFT_269438 [Basidiobolus meristosporus CBS 931.73]
MEYLGQPSQTQTQTYPNLPEVQVHKVEPNLVAPPGEFPRDAPASTGYSSFGYQNGQYNGSCADYAPKHAHNNGQTAAFDPRTYELQVCQQPLHARMCGFGEKDRRPIDPPPIIQLIAKDQQGRVDASVLQNPFFVLHVTLWSEDGLEERNIISNPPKSTRVLMGSLVSSPNILKNPDGEQGCYFCFPDLSIRTEGRYCLKFSLMKLGGDDCLSEAKSDIISQTFSEPFTVYSAKKFPGMTESTELSKAFARQGLKIPIRNDVRPRKAGD